MASKKDEGVPPIPVPPAPYGPVSTSAPQKPPTAPKTAAPKTAATGKAPTVVPPVEPAPKVGVKAPVASPVTAPGAPPGPPAWPDSYANSSGAYGPPATVGQPYAYVPAQTRPQGLSIASMICGIAGIFFGLLASIAAVILGHIASKRQPYARGLWLTGLITGYVGIGLWVLIIGAYVIVIVIVLTTSTTTQY
jgi:Domain of unknown function (DUF4190)